MTENQRALGVIVVGGVLACVACGGGTTEPTRMSAGVWGGDHALMTVGISDTHLEFDCASGDIPSVPTVDRQGQFVVAGTYVRGHGGPIRQGELPDSHPAIYSGLVASQTMTLAIQLRDTNESIGAFTLLAGSSGRVFKCL